MFHFRHNSIIFLAAVGQGLILAVIAFAALAAFTALHAIFSSLVATIITLIIIVCVAGILVVVSAFGRDDGGQADLPKPPDDL